MFCSTCRSEIVAKFKEIIKTTDHALYIHIAIILASHHGDVDHMVKATPESNEQTLVDLFHKWMSKQEETSDIRASFGVRLRKIGLNTQADQLIGIKTFRLSFFIFHFKNKNAHIIGVGSEGQLDGGGGAKRVLPPQKPPPQKKKILSM